MLLIAVITRITNLRIRLNLRLLYGFQGGLASVCEKLLRDCAVYNGDIDCLTGGKVPALGPAVMKVSTRREVNTLATIASVVMCFVSSRCRRPGYRPRN